MTHALQAISPLRQRMIDYVRMRQLSPKTQANYLRTVCEFTRFLGCCSSACGPARDRRLCGAVQLIRVLSGRRCGGATVHWGLKRVNGMWKTG